MGMSMYGTAMGVSMYTCVGQPTMGEKTLVSVRKNVFTICAAQGEEVVALVTTSGFSWNCPVSADCEFHLILTGGLAGESV